MKIEAILFDVIGTTVREKDPRTVIDSLVNAFEDHDVLVDLELIRANRGRDKKEMISAMLRENGLPSEHAGPIFESFKEHLMRSMGNFVANDHAGDLFLHLRRRKIKIGLGTGLSQDLFNAIMEHLKWDQGIFDYVGIASEFPKSRPHPDMILDMMRRLGIRDPRSVLKVGDTVADIQEGRNAGVRTAALSSGTQPERDLQHENPDFLLQDLAEIKHLIT